MLSLNEKKEILKVIFKKTDQMKDTEKSYILGYIKGFEDKANLSIIKENKQKKCVQYEIEKSV